MKKYWLISFVLVAVISCKKNEIPVSNDAATGLNVRVTNNHLNFKSAADYEKLFTLSKEDKKKLFSGFEKDAGFVSMQKKRKELYEHQGSYASAQRIIGACDVPDTLIEENDAFFSTLDANGIVEIEGAVYRYDYCGDKVWVISSADAGDTGSYDDFISGRERANVVGYFPSYVDALEAVAEGYKTMPDTSTVQGDETFARFDFFGLLGTTRLEHMVIHNDKENPKNEQLFDGKLDYQKFAIYFHFYGKEKYRTHCFFNWCTSSSGPRDWNVFFEYTYRRKGRDYDNSGSATITPPLSGENKVDKTFYEGSRGLKHGYAKWDVKHVYTSSVSTERNGGSTWYDVTHYTFSISQNPIFNYATNYFIPGGRENHFTIGW